MSEIILSIVHSLALIVIIIGVYLLYYYIKKYNLELWVNRAVRAAEILFDMPDTQEEKKQWVLKFIRENINPDISDEMLDCMIESAVESLNIAQQSDSAEKLSDLITSILDKELSTLLNKYIKEHKVQFTAEEINEAAKLEVELEKGQ